MNDIEIGLLPNPTTVIGNVGSIKYDQLGYHQRVRLCDISIQRDKISAAFNNEMDAKTQHTPFQIPSIYDEYGNELCIEYLWLRQDGGCISATSDAFSSPELAFDCEMIAIKTR